jgi:hypothetical protein
MTTAALSVAAVAALASSEPIAPGTDQSAGIAAAAPATEAPLILAQRRYHRYYRYYGYRRCMENLGYGRTGTYGCG